MSLEDERSVRKLLVCSSKECALISNGREVTGFGTTRQIGNNLCATVKFLGRGRWDVSINLPSPVRIAVNHGLPTMNSDALRKDAFAAALKATYGDVDSVQIQQIWLVVEQALSERVGCVVIVDAAAESEAARLATNAFPIAPAQLPDPGLSGIFGVDGAVLVDRQGVCHAFGVILDGTSRRGVGNRSRGARYNSVARYVDWRAGQAIGLVVSDDGGAEVLTAENAPAASQIR